MLNRRNPDGSINMLWIEGNNTSGIDVSPFVDNFRDQVEDDIWPAVSTLLSNNYLTVTSCQGHTLYDSAFVTVSFPSTTVADKFIDNVKSLLVYAEYDDTITSSTERLNQLFLKNYTEYYHVRVGVLQYGPCINFFLQPLKQLFINHLTNRLTSLPNYELIY
jgi:hypothetical protein